MYEPGVSVVELLKGRSVAAAGGGDHARLAFAAFSRFRSHGPTLIEEERPVKCEFHGRNARKHSLRPLRRFLPDCR